AYVTILLFVPVFCVRSQIDPVKRQLLQVGYNAALEGHPPQSIYAFYYQNQPGFLNTNLTLRLAIAPTYLDSELGISSALGEHTDLGIGAIASRNVRLRSEEHTSELQSR